MDRNRYLSIGEFSKLSNVNIKSLRYYDSLGILKPAYINPENNYRYYTFQQLNVVELICMCVELGIPLKDFPNYYENKGGQIHLEKLLSCGTERLEQIFLSVSRKLNLLKAIQEELIRASTLPKIGETAVMTITEKYIWISSCNFPLDKEEYFIQCKNIYEKIATRGLQPGCGFGMLHYYDNGTERHYLYTDVDNGNDVQNSNIIHIPQMDFLCQKVPNNHETDLSLYFPCLCRTPGIEIVFESEIYGNDYSVSNPEIELRYAHTNEILIEY